MNSFQTDVASGVLETATPPCLSLYQPTHRRHPENQQDAIRFKNLVKQLQTSLQKQFNAKESNALLAPFNTLADDHDFWSMSREGLAVLGAHGLFRVYRLQRAVPELAVVAPSFHTKPLHRLAQSTQRYQVLGLSRKAIRLFEGDRDTLDEVVLADSVAATMQAALGEEAAESQSMGGSHGSPGSGGRADEVDKDADRFFRRVDRDVLEHHSKAAGLPLILATLPENRELFHRVSRNPNLVKEAIDISPDAISFDSLRQRAWAVIEPFYVDRLRSQLDHFQTARANGLGDEALPAVAEAVVGGRVATLLIDGDRDVPGHVDETTGKVSLADMSRPDVDDVLDDLGELARKHGAEVFIVPGDQLPSDTGVAAIYRY